MQTFKYTDGGRREAGIQEHNDCAVRAYALFHDIEYGKAHRLFASEGRRPMRGTSYLTIKDIMERDGFKTSWVKGDGMTVGQLTKQNPNATIYAIKRGHAFAIKNGVQYDVMKTGPKSRIIAYWMKEGQPAEKINVALEAEVIYMRERVVDKTKSVYAIGKIISAELAITMPAAQYYARKFAKR